MKYPHFARRAIVHLGAALTALVLILGVPAIASAACSNPNQQTCSPSWGINELFFGTGGAQCDPANPGISEHSASYCANVTAGETGVGNSIGGTTYQTQAGFNTDRAPSLTFCVYKTTCGDSPALNVGTLIAGTTSTGTVKFAVKTYLASNYQVVTYGAPPINSSYTINTLTTPTSPNSTLEQFGINLVANNSCGGGMPGSLGADPAQIPDSTFSFGVAAHTSGINYYDTACKFMYNSGDTIATSTKSSGETDFTISYIFNTTNLTRGGIYSMSQSLVATSTF